MKSLISAFVFAIPSICNAAYYLEDEVPANITAQLAVVEDKYQAQPTYSYNVPFYSTKYLLGPAAVSSLKNIMQDLTKAKNITIEGRPDANGQNDTDLSRRRALAIKNYLLMNGISESRINVSVQHEVKFDVNPSVFNSTIYTSDSIPKLPTKSKSSLYTEKVEIPAAVTPHQTNNPSPVKSTEVKPALQKPSAEVAKNVEPQKIDPKVEGSFNVLRKELSDKPQAASAIPTSIPTSYDLPVNSALDNEARSAISRLVGSVKEVAVISDGSISGYKKAKEICSYIGEITGTRPEIRTKGAAKGLVTVKG